MHYVVNLIKIEGGQRRRFCLTKVHSKKHHTVPNCELIRFLKPQFNLESLESKSFELRNISSLSFTIHRPHESPGTFPLICATGNRHKFFSRHRNVQYRGKVNTSGRASTRNINTAVEKRRRKISKTTVK